MKSLDLVLCVGVDYIVIREPSGVEVTFKIFKCIFILSSVRRTVTNEIKPYRSVVILINWEKLA